MTTDRTITVLNEYIDDALNLMEKYPNDYDWMKLPDVVIAMKEAVAELEKKQQLELKGRPNDYRPLTIDEAIRVIQDNWPDSNYTTLRKALTTAVCTMEQMEDLLREADTAQMAVNNMVRTISSALFEGDTNE